MPQGEATYFNERVEEIKLQLGEFDYGQKQEMDKSLTTMILEKRPAKILEDGTKYTGQWMAGTNIRAGQGVLIWPDGSVYEGWWKDNKANSKGRLIHVDGSMYQGWWKDDSCHGTGVYYHLNGTKYDGEWHENEQHGMGLETWQDGTKYEGCYVHG